MNSNPITIRHPASAEPSAMRRAQELLALCRKYYASRKRPAPTEDLVGGWLLLCALDGNWRAVNATLMGYRKNRAYDSHCLFIGAIAAQVAIDMGSRLPGRVRDHLCREFHEATRPGTPIAGAELVYSNENHPFCIAAMMVLGGRLLDRPCLERKGRTVLEGFSRKYGALGLLSEYNSPTYAGVQLYPLASIRRLARDPATRRLADLITDFIWTDILAHWHPPTQQSAGPHSRAYMEGTLGAGGDHQARVPLAAAGRLFLGPVRGTQVRPSSRCLRHSLDADVRAGSARAPAAAGHA